MKTCLSLCLATALGGLTPAFGQVPVPASPHSHSLSLSVEPVSTGGTTRVSDGTHDKRQNVTGQPGNGHEEMHTQATETTKLHESIQISVRNFGQLPDTAQVEWYFVAAPASHTSPEQEFIFDKGSKSINMTSGGTENIPVTSAEIASAEKKHDQVRKGSKGSLHAEKNVGEKETGSVLEGWMVRLVADGKVLDAQASKDQLTDVVKDAAKLASMKGH